LDAHTAPHASPVFGGVGTIAGYPATINIAVIRIGQHALSSRMVAHDKQDDAEINPVVERDQ